jgi:hypothetical protein
MNINAPRISFYGLGKVVDRIKFELVRHRRSHQARRHAPKGMVWIKTTISVTQEDIDNGCTNDKFACPLARAINRVLKPQFTSVVTNVLVYLTGDDQGLVFYLPYKATEFIKGFDTLGSFIVEPMVFELDIPEEFLA